MGGFDFGRLPQLWWVALTFAAGSVLCYALEIPFERRPRQGAKAQANLPVSESAGSETLNRAQSSQGWVEHTKAVRKWTMHLAMSFFFLWGAGLLYLLTKGLNLSPGGLPSEYVAALVVGVWFILTRMGAFALWERRINFVTRMGIINVVWTMICGAALTLVYAMGYLVEQVEASTPLGQELLLSVMTKVIDGSLALGGVLATAMSILWAGQVWRNANTPEGMREYKITAVSASKMVVAYFVIIAAFGMWVGVPLVSKLAVSSGLPPGP